MLVDPTTKAEHHEGVRAFAKSLKPALKLSLAALETLAVVAYKQPVTAPEIMEIRGVQGAGVLKTLLDRKLIAVAGRKNVIGKPSLKDNSPQRSRNLRSSRAISFQKSKSALIA